MAALVGRILQLIGMAILPVALYMGLMRDQVQTEVKLLFIGGAVYVIGWLIGKKPES